MKANRALRILIFSTLVTASVAHAADRTWTGGGTSGIWGGTGNWVGATPAQNNTDKAIFASTFSSTYASPRTVLNNGNRTIAEIEYTDPDVSGLAMTIAWQSGTNAASILTLAKSGGTPAIAVTQADRTLTISARLGGTNGFIKSGPGTLTISPPGSAPNHGISGSIVINDGILSLSDGLALQNATLDTTTSVTGTSTIGLETASNILALGGLSGDKDLASLFTSTSGGYTAVTALTLSPASSATYSATIANGAAGMTLTKSGVGTQTLGAVNSYTGATAIQVGTLKFSATALSSATTDVTVATAATGGVVVTDADVQWANSGSLTLQNSSTLLLDYGSVAPSITIAPIQVANFTVGAGLTLRISAASASGFEFGQTYKLVNWTGSGPVNASAFTLDSGALFGGLFSVSGNTLSVTITGQPQGQLSWNTGNGNWDTIASNWLTSSLSPTSYIDPLDSVLFGDATGATGNPVITLNSSFSPVSVTMNSSSHDYTLTGAGGIVGITGLTLDATNSKTLTLGTSNSYSGPTIISGGTLKLGAAEVIPDGVGKGGVTVAGGATLDLDTFSETVNGLAGTGMVDKTAAGASTLAVGAGDAASSFSGTLQNTVGTLSLVKTGTGTFTLSTANTFTGSTAIHGGVLVVTDVNALGGTGAITIAGGARLAVNVDAFSVPAPITLGNVGTTSTISQGISSAANYLTTIGKVSGNGSLNLECRGTGNPVAFFEFDQASDYAGNTTVADSGSSNCRHQVRLGVENALPTTTVLTLDGGIGSGSAPGRNTDFNLNGFNQTLAGLASATRSLRYYRVFNSSGTPATLTINNSIDTTFSGELGYSTTAINRAFSLVKTGTGSFTASGVRTYSGNTTVSGGTLSLGIANAVNEASTVTIAPSGATLNLTYIGTDTVDKLYIGSVQQAAGIYGKVGSISPTIGIPQITGDGTLTVTTGAPVITGYAAWAALNGASAILSEDHDNDGVSNGVEYFIGGPAGNTTGFTPLPGVVNTAGALSVTWTKAASYPGTYGTDFRVETSTTLEAASWTSEILDPNPGFTVTITGNAVKYTFPAGTSNFARLKVTGP